MAPSTATDPWLAGRHFGIVIDAGSSGSRLQIYSWTDPRTIKVPKGSDLAYTLPKVEKGTKEEEQWVKKVEPGLSSLAENPQDASAYLQPLLQHALDHVPPSLHKETPLFLLATAGMRLLSPQKQAAILSETCRFLRRNSSFKIDRQSAAGPCGSSVRIITGEEEGLFGWIAVNYLMDGFTGALDQRTTYGFLDMGGASTQIAFEPSVENRGEKEKDKSLIDVRLRLMGGEEIRHKVFVTTWLGYGTNQARERYVGKAITDFEATRQHDEEDEEAEAEEEDAIEDPCLPKDLELVEEPVHTTPATSHMQLKHTLVGTGSFEGCLNKTAALLNKNKPCPDTPCLMNGVHVPPIDFSASHFIGVSEYWYSSEHIFGLGGAYDFVQYERAASEFCSRDWKNILSEHERSRKEHHLGGDGEVVKDGKVVGVDTWGPEVEIPRLQMQCFKAAWIANVLHEGLGLPRIVDPGGNATTDGDKVEVEAGRKGLGRPAFQSMDTVGDIAISWTLGKMVLEASKEVPPLSKHARPLVDPIDDIDDLEHSPIQPIRPPFLSFSGIEDRITPHLPTSLTRSSLGFSPVFLLMWVFVMALFIFVCYPLRRQIRSMCVRSLRNVSGSRRDQYYDDLTMEEGRIGGGSRPASPTMFGGKVPSPLRHFFPTHDRMKSNFVSPLSLITNNLPRNFKPSSGSRRSSPTRGTFSMTTSTSNGSNLNNTSSNGNGKLDSPTAIASTTQYIHSTTISRSSSPAPPSMVGSATDDWDTGGPASSASSFYASRSRNASQMSLSSLVPRPIAMSRSGSFAGKHL